MIRAVIELLVTIFIILFARAVLTSVMRALTKASAAGAAGQSPNTPPNGASPRPSTSFRAGGDLHKDPVCGTYVSESTPFQRQSGREKFFYCSDACKQKHALVSR